MAGNSEFAGVSVIVSSNRYNDLAPYCNALFKLQPEIWFNVLPWEFPQNATREVEEAFLRQFFDEREIYMQGGAVGPEGGPGNGFKFLKQVWYSAAMWNADIRIPAVANWWFQQESNQSLLDDPSMIKWMLAEDTKPETFFGHNEMNMYGPKVLEWAVKHIQASLQTQLDAQAHLQMQLDAEAQNQMHGATHVQDKTVIDPSLMPHVQDEKNPPSLTTTFTEPNTAQFSGAHKGLSTTHTSSQDEPTSTTSAFPVMESSEFHTPRHAVTTSKSPPTHKSDEYAFSHPSVREPVTQPHDFVEPYSARDQNYGLQPMEQRENIPAGRGRGDGGSRGRNYRGKCRGQQDPSNNASFHERDDYPRSYGNFGPGPIQNPHMPQNRQISGLSHTSMSPSFMMQQPHGPPMLDSYSIQQQFGGQFDNPQQNRIAPPGFSLHQMPPQVPHQAYHQVPQQYWSGAAPDDHIKQRRVHRVSSDDYSAGSRDSMSNSRHSANSRDHQNYRGGKRRAQSVNRGRRGRGGDSFPGGSDVFQGNFFNPHQRNPNAPMPGVVYMPTGCQNTGSHQKNWKSNQEPLQGQSNENSAPWFPVYDPGMQDPNMHNKSIKMPPNQYWNQTPQSHNSLFVPQPKMTISRTLYDPNANDEKTPAKKVDPLLRYLLAAPRDSADAKDGNDSGSKIPSYIVQKNHIGRDCTHAKSLAVFQPRHDVRMTESEFEAFFAQFGRVTNVSHSSYPDSGPSFVDFESHFAAIKTLERLGGDSRSDKLRVEVPKRFWDPEHNDFVGQIQFAPLNWQPSNQGHAHHARGRSGAPVKHGERPENNLAEKMSNDLLSDSNKSTASGHTSNDKKESYKKAKRSKKQSRNARNETPDILPGTQQHPSMVKNADGIKHGDTFKSGEYRENDPSGDTKALVSQKADTSSEESANSHEKPQVRLPRDNLTSLSGSETNSYDISPKTQVPTDSKQEQTKSAESQGLPVTKHHEATEEATPTSKPRSSESTTAKHLNSQQERNIDEDRVDESFHTATGSTPEVTSDQIDTARTNDGSIEISPSTAKEEEKTPKSTPRSKKPVSNISAALGDVIKTPTVTPDPKVSTASTPHVQNISPSTKDLISPTSEAKSSLKAPTPPDLSTRPKESTVSPKSTSHKPSDYSRTASHVTVGSTSGSTIVAAPFVTAPTTPSETRVEPPPKKVEKAKGPAHTESLSMFGKKTKQGSKKKEKKKAIGGSMRGQPKSGNSTAESFDGSSCSLADLKRRENVSSLPSTLHADGAISEASTMPKLLTGNTITLPASSAVKDRAISLTELEVSGTDKRDSTVDATRGQKTMIPSQSDNPVQENLGSPKAKPHWTQVFSDVQKLISAPRKLSIVSPESTVGKNSKTGLTEKTDLRRTSDSPISKSRDDPRAISRSKDARQAEMTRELTNLTSSVQTQQQAVSENEPPAPGTVEWGGQKGDTEVCPGLGISTPVDLSLGTTAVKGKKKKTKNANKEAKKKPEQHEQAGSMATLFADNLKENKLWAAGENRFTDHQEQGSQSVAESPPTSPAPLSRRAAAVAAKLALGQQNKHLVTATERAGRTKKKGIPGSLKQAESPEKVDRSSTVIDLSGSDNSALEQLQLYKGKLSEPDWHVELARFQGQLSKDLAEAKEAIKGPESKGSDAVIEMNKDDNDNGETSQALVPYGTFTDSNYTLTPEDSSTENEDERA